MIYVTMTDTFMSGWGKADGKKNIYAVACESMEQAQLIEKNAKKRSEMKNVKIRLEKPYYSEHNYLVTWKHFDNLSGPWKE